MVAGPAAVGLGQEDTASPPGGRPASQLAVAAHAAGRCCVHQRQRRAPCEACDRCGCDGDRPSASRANARARSCFAGLCVQ